MEPRFSAWSLFPFSPQVAFVRRPLEPAWRLPPELIEDWPPESVVLGPSRSAAFLRPRGLWL